MKRKKKNVAALWCPYFFTLQTFRVICLLESSFSSIPPLCWLRSCRRSKNELLMTTLLMVWSFIFFDQQVKKEKHFSRSKNAQQFFFSLSLSFCAVMAALVSSWWSRTNKEKKETKKKLRNEDLQPTTTTTTRAGLLPCLMLCVTARPLVQRWRLFFKWSSRPKASAKEQGKWKNGMPVSSLKVELETDRLFRASHT